MPKTKNIQVTLQKTGRMPKNLPRKATIEKWLQTAFLKSINIKYKTVTCNVRFTTKKESAKLNKEYRGKDYATNILSFPCPKIPNNDYYLGDLVICLPVVIKEAKEQEKTFTAHLAHMLAHGMLHLLGYTHEKKPDAKKMEKAEIMILKKLNFPDPYC